MVSAAEACVVHSLLEPRALFRFQEAIIHRRRSFPGDRDFNLFRRRNIRTSVTSPGRTVVTRYLEYTRDMGKASRRPGVKKVGAQCVPGALLSLGLAVALEHDVPSEASKRDIYI